MATYWTLNNHLDNFQAFGDAHLQINSYSFGDLVKADLNTKKELFPVMHTQFVSCQPGTNILNWTFRFIFFDIPKDDDISSILECQSDMLNVAKDLISYFKNGPYRPIYTFVDSSLITPFQEKHQNINAGVFFDITFKTAESYASCDLPLRDFQIISEIPGGQVIFLGDVYTTGASLVDNIAVFQRNDGLTYSLDLSGFSSGTPSLSEVLDEGNTSGPNDIVFDSSQGLLFNNNSRLREGTIDAGLGGNKGIAQICGVGYELKWEAGRLYVMNGNGNGIRQSLYNFGITPSVNDDITYGYTVGSIWGLDDLNYYICVDNSTGAAVWDLISGTISLSDLTDVLITSTPSNGDSLVYNSSINKWEPGITAVNYDRLFDYTGTYSYSGTAPQGSLITDPLWDITRIQYFGSGTGSISTSTQSVPWVDRYIVTYV